MISKFKISSLATSVALVLYAPQVLAEEAPNYTIEFAQPASAAPNASTRQATTVPSAPNPSAPSTISAPSYEPYADPSLPTLQIQGANSNASAPTAYSSQPAPSGALQANTSANSYNSADFYRASGSANSTYSAAPTNASTAPMQTQMQNHKGTAQSTASYQTAMASQAPAAPNSLFTINQNSDTTNQAAGNTATTAIEMEVPNANEGQPPLASQKTNSQYGTAQNTNSQNGGDQNSGYQNAGYQNGSNQGSGQIMTGTENVPYEIESLNNNTQYQEDALRQEVTDQRYPATLNENGTDDFYQSQSAAVMQQSQGKAQGTNFNNGQGATANNGLGITPNNGQSAMTNATGSGQPSFTFETASAEQTQDNKPSNLFPLGSHAITTPDGKQIMVGPDGRPLLDANGQPIPAPLEQLQEVSVLMLTTLDNALINAFKSLESGLTLGMGQSSYNYTVDDIAPAIRGYTFEEDGNLVVRFSVNAAERIIKNHGSLSWSGLSNPILVWMVGLNETEGTDKLTLVSGQNLSRFAQAIINAAPDYKYRLMFPILDLEDVQKVQVNTVLNHEDTVLAEASQRYGADYFIAAAINNTDSSNSGVILKWNLYNKKGELIAQSSLTGLLEEVASLGAGDIARAVMTYQKEQKYNPETKPEDTTPAELTANNVDIERLGAGDGFIRIKVENVRALSDFNRIRKAFVTYGYDGDIRVIGYDNGSMILELVTNSNIVNLEGTIRRAGDFVYLAPWTYRFNSTAAPRRSMQEGITNQRSNTPASNGSLIIRGN